MRRLAAATRTLDWAATHMDTYPATALHTAPSAKPVAATKPNQVLLKTATPSSLLCKVGRNWYEIIMATARGTAHRPMAVYCTCKKPAAPSRMGVATAHNSLVPVSCDKTVRHNHVLIKAPVAQAAVTSTRMDHVVVVMKKATTKATPHKIAAYNFNVSSDVCWACWVANVCRVCIMALRPAWWKAPPPRRCRRRLPCESS